MLKHEWQHLRARGVLIYAADIAIDAVGFLLDRGSLIACRMLAHKWGPVRAISDSHNCRECTRCREVQWLE